MSGRIFALSLAALTPLLSLTVLELPSARGSTTEVKQTACALPAVASTCGLHA